MGPPKFIGGNLCRPFNKGLLKRASMGPPKFIGGNSSEGNEANMILLSFNGAAEIHRRKSPDKSGGAAGGEKLQWGRRNSSAEIVSPCNLHAACSCGFNGAAEIHRRKYHWQGDTDLPRESFNGAAEIHRRKWTTARSDTRRPGASMGPPKFIGGNADAPTESGGGEEKLQWGRRNSSAEMAARRRRWQAKRSFNGAAEIHRRKYSKRGGNGIW